MDKYPNVFRTQGLLDLKKCFGSIEEKPKKKGNLRIVPQFNSDDYDWPDEYDDYLNEYDDYLDKYDDYLDEDISGVSGAAGFNFLYDPMRCEMCDDGTRYKIINTIVDSDGEPTLFEVQCPKCRFPTDVSPEEIIRFNGRSETDKIAKMISKYQKFAKMNDPDFMDDYDLPDLDDEDLSDLQLDQAVNPGYKPVGFEEDPFVDDELGPKYDEYLKSIEEDPFVDDELRPEYDEYLKLIEEDPDLDADYFSKGPDVNLEDEKDLESENNFKNIMKKYIR